VAALAREGRFDDLLVESTGISEPLPMAETFTIEDEHGKSPSVTARLDTMITVVDAGVFFDEWAAADGLVGRGVALNGEDEHTGVDLLADQIDFANVVNKNYRVDTETVEGVLRQLNLTAAIVRTERGVVPFDQVLDTALTARLDACLLTDDERALGREVWEAFEDPFPAWTVATEADVECVGPAYAVRRWSNRSQTLASTTAPFTLPKRPLVAHW
jgi:G3E family GTPase